MDNNGIKAITFDLWNTLIVDTLEGGRTRASRRMQATRDTLQNEGYSFDIEQIGQAYSVSQRIFEEIRSDGLDTNFSEQMDIFLGLIDDGLEENLSTAARERISLDHANTFFDDPPALMPGVPEILETLKERGYRLGLICNSGATPGCIQRQFLKDKGVSYHLDVLTFSDEERLAKPSPAMFLDTLKALDVLPENTVHIGDRPETDILGAKALGMKAVLIGPASPEGIGYDPDAHIQHLNELPTVVESFNSTAPM